MTEEALSYILRRPRYVSVKHCVKILYLNIHFKIYKHKNTINKTSLKNGVLGIQNGHKKSLKIKKIFLRNTLERVHYYVTFHIATLQIKQTPSREFFKDFP